MPSLDQARALLAHEHVSAVVDWEDASKKKYAGIVLKLPALIRSAGLSQALHFVATRKPRDGKHLLVLEHLAGQLARVDASIKSPDALLLAVRKADLAAYLVLTREALACVDWYRRFVQSLLGIYLAEDQDDGD